MRLASSLSRGPCRARSRQRPPGPGSRHRHRLRATCLRHPHPQPLRPRAVHRPRWWAQPPDEEADDGLAEDDRAPIGALLAGLGGLAAAGIIHEVGLRRRRAQSHRRPGDACRRCPLQSPRPDRVLRAHQQPITLDVLRASLRALLRTCRETGQPMPRIGAILLDPERIDLHLTEPTTPTAQAWRRTAPSGRAYGVSTTSRMPWPGKRRWLTTRSPTPALPWSP